MKRESEGDRAQPSKLALALASVALALLVGAYWFVSRKTTSLPASMGAPAAGMTGHSEGATVAPPTDPRAIGARAGDRASADRLAARAVSNAHATLEHGLPRPLPPTVSSTPLPPEGSNAPAPASRGRIDVAAVRQAIHSALPAVQACYEKQLQRNPSLAGRVTVRLMVRAHDGKGRIDDADILPGKGQEDLDSPLTEQCVLAALASVDFPAPEDAGDGGIEIHYPFILKNE